MHSTKKSQPGIAPAPPGLSRRHALVIALTSAVVAAMLSWGDLAGSLGQGWNDAVLRLAAGRLSAHPRVVLVVIDDQDLRHMNKEVGRFPWPRVFYAPVVDHVSRASTIGFDILFPEYESQFGFDDGPFREAMHAQGRVVLACHLQPHPEDGESLETLLPHSLPLPAGDSGTGGARSVLLPLKKLLDAADGVGQVNRTFDPDGRMRAYPLWQNAGGRRVPSLALALAARHTGRPLSDFSPDPGPASPPLRLPGLAPDGSFLYLPVSRGFRSYAFTDLVRSWREEAEGRPPSIPPSAFDQAIVLIGTTATGLTRDWVPTPLGPETPGLLLHAMALDNLLSSRWMRSVPVGWGMLAALLLVVGFALGVQNRPIRIGTGTVLLVAAALAADAASVVLLHLHLPLLPVVLSLVLCGVGLVVHNWIHERRQVRRLETLEAYKQQFTDMLVHDIKGKIGTLELSLSQLDDGVTPLPPASAEMAGIARATSRNLLTHVSALLDVRRLEEGRLELRPVPLDLHLRLEEMAPEFHASAAAYGLTFRLDLDPALEGVSLTTDPDIAIRILENFLWNALDHATPGSEVVLGSRREGGGVEVFVENEGPLIPAHELDTLFEPFLTRRAADPRARGTHAGLGLAFCKMGAQALGGDVRLRSPLPTSGKPGARASLHLAG